VPGVHALELSPDVVGGWLQLPGSATAELLGSVGFGFVCVDQQHGLIGDDALLPMLQALAATDTPAVVRVAENEPGAIGRALDRGAAGVIVPMVDTAEDAASAVSACHHPPGGTRSYGPTRLAWTRAAAPPQCIVMIETLAAVEAAPAIAAVDGLDAVFIGPWDLALSAGVPPSAQLDDPGYEQLLRRVVAACQERGLPVGIYCASPAHVHHFRGLGFTFFALMSDAGMLLAAATTYLAAARDGADSV
jgi:4-hydroxy-2-oxoheptanedioate aldolase